MSRGDVTYVISINQDKHGIEEIIVKWANSVKIFKTEYKGHVFFQTKDLFGRIIGRKRKCFEYEFKNNKLILKAWLGNYKRRTSLDGSYGWLISDEFKHYLSDLFFEISNSDFVEKKSTDGKTKNIKIRDLVVNKIQKKAIYPWWASFVSVIAFILCPIYGWPGIVLLPLGFWLAFQGIHKREGKVMAVFAIVVLIVDTFFCVVRIFANFGVYLFV